MSNESERSVNSLADSRKDFGGECSRNVSSCDGSSGLAPGSVTKPSESNEENQSLHYDLQKTSDLSTQSSSLGGGARKNSLQLSNSETTSYSSMEAADFQIFSQDVNRASSQNKESNSVDTSASNQLKLQPGGVCSCLPNPEVRGENEEEAIVPDSFLQIASQSSCTEPAVTSANREEVQCVVSQCPSVAVGAQNYRRDRDVAGQEGVNEKKTDKFSVYFSKAQSDSVENLIFISESADFGEKQDSNILELSSDSHSDVTVFPGSCSTSLSGALLEKPASKSGGPSLDQPETNDTTKFSENGSCLQSGSSTESGSVMVQNDSIERAKEILGHSVDIFVTPSKESSPKATLRTHDGPKAAGDIGLNGLSSKVGKSSSDKKKRGLSWYSRQKKLVLSPTYKSRSDDFKRIFKDIPSAERLIVDYSCALQKDILVHGRLYISQSWICFYANIFRWETMLTIRCKDVVKLTKERTARVIPNAIQICSKDDKYFFTSFGTRDKTYLMLDRVWRNGVADETMSRRELWQWVHYSYGEELGLTSGDEDYIPLSAEEKINFQTRIQKEEHKLQKLSQRGDVSMAAEIIKESSGDYLVLNGDLQPSVEDADSSLADNLSVTSVDDSIYAYSEGQNLTESPADMGHLIPHTALGSGCQESMNAGDVSSEVEEEDEDSTGDDDVDRCAGHAHFGIDVVDEMLNIPIDVLFEHCFTDSPLYREFVKNKKTFDVVLSPWPEEPDATGVKVRNIAYTLSLGYSIGPKYSPSTERQIMYPESQPGHFYLIDTECINGGIPYGENFYIVNRYCISKISSSKCRLRITSELRYRKSVWGFVRNFIDKNATAGIIESFNVLADLLRQESDRHTQLANGQTGAVGRRKFLRRRRPVDRSPVKLPSADIQHQATSKQSTPVKHFTPKVSAAKVKEDWHMKLTVDILVRIVCAVLILLMVFNAVLFYKLWSLEATTANVLLTQKPLRFNFPDPKDSHPPESNEEWASLLKKQRVLHDSEINHWKDILSTSIQLMDEMIQALTDLRSSIDKHSLRAKEDPETDASKIT